MQKSDIYIALENVRSLFNVGAIFRTCSFFGFYNVILLGYSGVQTLPGGKKILNPRISKTSLDSEKDLVLHFMDTVADLYTFASMHHLELVSLEQSPSSLPLHSYTVTKPSIFIFGNEKEGVSQESIAASGFKLEISRYGKHNSLNIATSCGITLYHLSNQFTS